MRKFNITVNGVTYEVEVEEISAGTAAAPSAAPVPQAAPAVPQAAPAKQDAPKPAAHAPKAAAPAAGSIQITSPMPGNIMKVNVSTGAAVKKGDILIILEAMKMENEILAPEDGTVASVAVSQGVTVASGDLLVTLK